MRGTPPPVAARQSLAQTAAPHLHRPDISPWFCVRASLSGDTTPCKVTQPILHGVVVMRYRGRGCVKSLRSSYKGMYPQSLSPCWEQLRGRIEVPLLVPSFAFKVALLLPSFVFEVALLRPSFAFEVALLLPSFAFTVPLLLPSLAFEVVLLLSSF